MLYEQGFNIFPIGSPFVPMPEFWKKKVEKEGRERVMVDWCKTPLEPWKVTTSNPLKENQIEFLFGHKYPGCNIGINTHGLVYVDADNVHSEKWCDENISQGIKIITTKGAHYPFINRTGNDYRNKVNVDSGLDIRANGGYVVSHGSTHGRGAKYHWEQGFGIQFDTIEDLPEMTNSVWDKIKSYTQGTVEITQDEAKGNLQFDASKVKPIGSALSLVPAIDGGRNDKVAETTGALLNAGASLQEINMILKNFNCHFDPPLSIEELERTISSVVRTRMQKDGKIPDVYTKELTEKETWKPTETKSDFPEWIFAELPSNMQDMMDFINKNSVKKQPLLSFASILPLFGTILGQKIQLERYRTRTNIYTLGIARSGAGKNAALTNIKNAMREGNIDRICVEGFSSDAGFLRRVNEKPSSLCLIDELGKVLSSILDSRAPKYLKAIESELLTLYGSANTTYNPKHLANSESDIQLNDPNISVYGVTTPTALFKTFSSETIEGGLLSRLLLFDTDDEVPMSEVPENAPVPESFKDWASEWEHRPLNDNPVDLENGVLKIKPSEIRYDVQALEFYSTETRRIEKFAGTLSDGLDAIFIRAPENASKIALIIAGCRSTPDSVSVLTIADLRIGFAVSEYCANLMYQKATTNIADNDLERDTKKVLGMIRKSANGLTLRDMKRKSFFKKLSKRDFETIIENLNHAEEIELRNTNTTGKGRPRNAFIALA